MEMSKQRLLCLPGLSAKVSMHKLTIATSGVLYAPSIGDLPAGCVSSSLGRAKNYCYQCYFVPYKISIVSFHNKTTMFL